MYLNGFSNPLFGFCLLISTEKDRTRKIWAILPYGFPIQYEGFS